MTNEWLEGKHGRYRLGELLVSEEGLNIYLAKRLKRKWSAPQTRTRNIASLICVGKFDPRIPSGKYDLREEGSIVLDNTLLERVMNLNGEFQQLG